MKSGADAALAISAAILACGAILLAYQGLPASVWGWFLLVAVILGGMAV